MCPYEKSLETYLMILVFKRLINLNIFDFLLVRTKQWCYVVILLLWLEEQHINLISNLLLDVNN